MQPRIIIALLLAVSFAALSQVPDPPSGLVNEKAATPMNQPLQNSKGKVPPVNDAVHGAKGDVAEALPDAGADDTPGLLQQNVCPPELQGRNATAGAIKITAGFDTAPFVQAEFPNGEVRIVRPLETRVWHHDGSKSACRVQTAIMQETPAGSPPDLPADPMRGRRWMERQNMRLHELISLFARGDQKVLAAIDAEEQRVAGPDLFKQITFRTGVLKSYIKAGL